VIRRLLACALLVSLPGAVALGLAGCAKRHHINIESNTCWTAVVDNEGGPVAVGNECGNVNFRVAGDVHCVRVTNLNDTGFVRVRIDDGVFVTNSAPRGTAEACR